MENNGVKYTKNSQEDEMMKIITLQMLLEKLQSDAKGSRGCGWITLGFLAIILIGGGAAITSPLTLIPILIFGVLGVVMLHQGKLARKSAKNRSFYLVTDVCRKKHSESRGEDGDAYILTFESGLVHTISSDDVFLSSPTEKGLDEWLYNQTEVGDSFFLVYLQKETKPSYIISQRFCQLDKTGFAEENGRLIPRA